MTTHHARPRLFPVGCVCLAGMALAGCGDQGGLRYVPVSGVVTVNGEPAGGLTVNFKPQSVAEANVTGSASQGTTDENGRYKLSTTTGTIRQAAVVGTHRVTVTGLETLDAVGYDMLRANDMVVPEFELDEEAKRGLEYVVESGGTSNADFDLAGERIDPAEKFKSVRR